MRCVAKRSTIFSATRKRDPRASPRGSRGVREGRGDGETRVGGDGRRGTRRDGDDARDARERSNRGDDVPSRGVSRWATEESERAERAESAERASSTPPPCSPPTPPPPPTPPTPPLLLWRVDARRTCPTRNSTAKSPPSRARGGGGGALPALVAARLDALRETLEVFSANGATNRRRRCGDAARARTSSRSTKHSSEPRNVARRRCYRRRSRSRRRLAKRARFVSATRRARVRLRDATATARAVLDEYLREDVWNLPTSVEDLRRERARRTGRGTGGDGDGSTPTRFASEVGGFDSDAATVRENALLVSLAAEGVGAAARVGGREFIRRGGFLPLALCPLLRRLGDPAPDVRDAARHALEVTARVGGYTPDEGTEGGEEGGEPPPPPPPPSANTMKGPREERREASPRRLLHPQLHRRLLHPHHCVGRRERGLRRLGALSSSSSFGGPPRRRSFFRRGARPPRASSARLLLPLLSEPVGRALDALSIARRRAHDGDVAALLDVARSVADAVEEDAASVAVEAEEARAEARPLAAMLDEMREFQEENDANFPGEEETSSADDPERSAKNLRSLVASSPHRDACVSFDASATMSAWRRRARRQSNLSRLATSVLSAAAPLMESSDDGRRVSACEACASALRALRGVEICVETDREAPRRRVAFSPATRPTRRRNRNRDPRNFSRACTPRGRTSPPRWATDSDPRRPPNLFAPRSRRSRRRRR